MLVDLDDDLACSATKTVADKIQKAYSAKFRKNKSADGDEKEEMARSAFVTACSADSASSGLPCQRYRPASIL